MRKTGMALVLLLAVVALVAAGCGGDDDDSGGGSSANSGGASTSGGSSGGGGSGGGGASQTLALAAPANGDLKFDKDTLTGKAGKATIVLKNPSSVPHAIEIEGQGVEEEGDTVTDGGVSKVSVTLKPGKYEYYCPVDGHKQAGMKGTLTVQ